MSYPLGRAITMTCLLLAGASSLAQAQTEMQSILSDSRMLAGRASIDYSLPVDATMSIEVRIFTTAAPAVAFALDTALIDPQGVQVQPGPTVTFEKIAFPIGVSYRYVVQIPQPGIWQLRLQSTADSPMNYDLGADIENSPVILTAGAPPVVVANAPAIVHATLKRRHHPLANAHASALITLPSGAAASVPLADDGSGEDEQAGDGLFTGVFTGTTEVGNYQVAIVGSGHYARGPFRRQVRSSLHVPPAVGAIGDDITDFPDTSGEAPSPQFLIDLPVTVPSAGPYFVDVTIQDRLGTEIGRTEHFDLPAGESRVQVAVTGFDLFAFSSNGPYTVTFIRVVNDTDPRIPVAVRSTPYTTAPYSILDFGYAETPGTPELALTTQSIVDVGDGRVLWTGLLTNVGDGSVRVGVVKRLGVRLPEHSKGTIANFASRLPGAVRSFVRDLQPNQSVQVSAILTPDKKVKRVTFVARAVISDGRGDVHRVVAEVSAKMP